MKIPLIPKLAFLLCVACVPVGCANFDQKTRDFASQTEDMAIDMQEVASLLRQMASGIDPSDPEGARLKERLESLSDRLSASAKGVEDVSHAVANSDGGFAGIVASVVPFLPPQYAGIADLALLLLGYKGVRAGVSKARERSTRKK